MEKKLDEIWWRKEFEELLGRYAKVEIEAPELTLFVYRVIGKELLDKYMK